jgi:Protein of unknown function, DUF547
MSFLKKIFIPIFFFLCVFPFGACAATALDYASWDAFLKKNVNEKGEVDYRRIKSDPKELNDFLETLTQAGGGDMKAWPREEALAFWLNAYHAAMIKLVVEHYPVTSVQRIPSFWDVTAFRIGKIKAKQTQFSLNRIRLGSLMSIYRDEKIHLALSTASRSGPAMMREAFTGPKVEGQLFLLTRKFVSDPRCVDVVPGRKKIKISRIFKWYASDFKLDFGALEPRGKLTASENSVVSFLAYYLEDETKDEYLQNAQYKIDYFPYDWTLNDWKR